MTKANSATSPLAVGSHDVFGNKSNWRRLADQLVLIGVGFGRDQGKHCGAVGRRNTHPALPGLKAHIEGETESKLIHIESQAPILITDENVDRVNAEIAILAILILTITRQRGLICQTERWGAGHGGYYKTTKDSD